MSAVFRALGLSDDADERAVKRAYAQRLKIVRPDTDPAGFQRLHEQYQAALEIVRRRKSAAPVETDEVPVAITSETPSEEVAIPSIRVSFDSNVPHTPSPPLLIVLDDADFASAPALPQPVVHLTFDVDPAPDFPLRPDSQALRKHLDFRDETPPKPAAATKEIELDFATFYAQLLHAAQSGIAKPVIDFLQAQPALWSLQLKIDCGKQLLDALHYEKAGMSTAIFDAAMHFFDLDIVQPGQNGLKIRTLRQRLQVRWEFADRRVQECLRRIVIERQDARYNTGATLGYARKILQPGSWPVFIAQAASPGTPGAMASFIRASFGDRLQNVPESVDRRVLVRWLRMADPQDTGLARFCMLLLRGLLGCFAAYFGGMNFLTRPSDVNVGIPLALMGAMITLVFLIWHVWRWLRNWQNLPQQTDEPRPWLRWGFLPVIAGVCAVPQHGGAKAFAVASLVALLGLAISRWRARRGLALFAIKALTFAPLLMYCLGWTAFLIASIQWSEAGAAAVLLVWSLDLGRHLSVLRAARKG